MPCCVWRSEVNLKDLFLLSAMCVVELKSDHQIIRLDSRYLSPWTHPDDPDRFLFFFNVYMSVRHSVPSSGGGPKKVLDTLDSTYKHL